MDLYETSNMRKWSQFQPKGLAMTVKEKRQHIESQENHKKKRRKGKKQQKEDKNEVEIPNQDDIVGN